MKTRPIKRKVLTLLLALCVVLSLVPVAVFGTRNTIRSGDVNLEVSGAKNHTFINALDAAGSLTIEGGTGSLSVYAGALKNKGDAWVYSSGISVDGDFAVKGGQVTARGGSVESDGSCFSFGVKMDSDTKNKALLVTGGTLTAIADEAYELEEGGTKRASFSRGVEMFRGNEEGRAARRRQHRQRQAARRECGGDGRSNRHVQRPVYFRGQPDRGEFR